MPAKYPHLLPEDCDIWDRWRTKNPHRFTHFNYDVHVGEGRQSNILEPPSIPAMERRLSQRRIDVIGFAPHETVIIEITKRAGMTTLGQITAYPFLYQLMIPDGKVPGRLVVCEEIGTDLAMVFHSIGITVELV